MAVQRPAPGISTTDLDVVMRAARAFSAVVATSLARTDDVVTWPQLRVLVLVATRPDVTATAVADALDIHLSSASRLCDRLVNAGLVERRTSTSDRRNLLLSLTAKGSELIEQIMQDRRRAFTSILEQMTPSDRIALHHCLEIFAQAAGEPPEDSLLFG
ncbi:MarR family transcriptional regulator [Lapillicoccus sp.]|uniref:MarR family winged helix-turn-helix transcriptional regulator n=1 Tax=Lapillicoccus sp. TaxID=1909287 RepID=UPI0027C675D0|nr:MarR family transcriptional regulator [Actinomycetota bacterium]